MLRNCPSAKLLRVEPDGTKVYRRHHKILRVTEGTQPCGFYAPFHSRRDMYHDKRDPRTTKEFAKAVRDRRQHGFTAGVKPGPQLL
jgi:hypothetical protein